MLRRQLVRACNVSADRNQSTEKKLNKFTNNKINFKDLMIARNYKKSTRPLIIKRLQRIIKSLQIFNN